MHILFPFGDDKTTNTGKVWREVEQFLMEDTDREKEMETERGGMEHLVSQGFWVG